MHGTLALSSRITNKKLARHMPVIPVLERLGQKDKEFKSSLGCKTLSQKKKNTDHNCPVISHGG
jgi:hypothetical protein